MPLGHCSRGSSTTPARLSVCPAASVAADAMSAGNQRPAQLSQRPQAWAVSSSRTEVMYSIRHPAVSW